MDSWNEEGKLEITTKIKNANYSFTRFMEEQVISLLMGIPGWTKREVKAYLDKKIV